MKKIIACIASAVMLAACFAASVSAEQDGAQNPGNVRAEETSDTTTMEDESSDPGSTAEETTEPTEAPVPRFTFQNSSGESLTVEWNAEDFPGVSVTVNIGGTDCGTYSGSPFRVSLSGLTPGTYTMTYRLSNGETVSESQPVYVGGSLNISMTVRLSNNRVTAQLRDSHNRPVAGCPVNLLFDTARQETGTSDASGNVTFNTALPSDPSVQIMCTADNFTSNFIHYTGCTASLEGYIVTTTTTTTTTQATTSTTTTTPSSSSESSESESSSTASTTTVTTYEMIQGAGTTAVVGDQIAVNVSFDTQVAASFGCSTADFAARARLLLSESAYTSLVGQSGSVLMMQAETSSAEVTDAMISQAINGESAYSRFDAGKTLRVPVELSLHLINSAQGIDTVVPMPGEEVTVQIPVPSAMNDEDKYQLAVAFLDESGISRIVDATVEDGVLSFQTTSFSAIAVLGFETDGTAASRGGFPTISIILIIVGVLMLAGAGVLLYFFFLRKPAPEDPEQPDGDHSDGEGVPEDSGEDDVRRYPSDGPEGGAETAEEEEAWEQAEESAEGEFPDTPENGVSLGSLINHPVSGEIPTTRKKNPSDYDLDL
ncbi:MAG TPA: hypothetical protein H9694_04220 [Firmicutes bacterium]|nr:hypothetical protein [Bacillota bacterium]